MDTIVLDEALREMGFNRESYSIGSLKDESLILLREDHKWKVFYFERGIRGSVSVFVKEAEACEFMLQTIKSWEGMYSKGPRS